MIPQALGKVAEMAGGQLIGNQSERHVIRICTDSRGLKPGDLFVALKGENFDGHDFVSQAHAAGAVAALVHRVPADYVPAAGFSLIRVEDTLKGLQSLAANYREKLSVRVAAVTGSNGKTSTKEFMAAVLSQRFVTHKTAGNLNNHIGVPLTLLSMDDSHEWAVVEMGMNHPGELGPLVGMARPDAGVITTIGWAHIEAFSSRNGIAEEKSQVIRHLAKDGLAVLNGDSELVRNIASSTAAKIVFAGSRRGSQYQIRPVEFQAGHTRFIFTAAKEEVEVCLPVPGWHMVQNAALALAFGIESGISSADAVRGLLTAELPKNRLHVARHSQGWLMDDTYNASPDSMQAAFQTLCRIPGGGRSVALLGSMGELGKFSEELHRWTGRAAAEEGIGMVLCCGPMARELVEGARSGGLPEAMALDFKDQETLVDYYQKLKVAGDRVLVKGSRSQRMERVVQELRKTGAACSTT